MSALVFVLASCQVNIDTDPKPQPQPQPIAVLSPNPLDFGANTLATFTVRNEGATGSRLNWSASISEPKKDGQPQAQAWFTLSPNSGSEARGEATPVTLKLTDGLSAGSYTATVVISYGQSSKSIAITKTITNNKPQPIATISPDAVDFADATRATINIQNDGAEGSSLVWQASVSEAKKDDQPLAAAWFTLSPSSGSESKGSKTAVNLQLNDALAAGRYTAIVVISYGSSSKSILVTKTVGQAIPSSTMKGKRDTIFLGINDVPSATVNYQITISEPRYEGKATSPWLRITPDKGIVSSDTYTIINMLANDNLATGRYQAIITLDFSSDNPAVEARWPDQRYLLHFTATNPAVPVLPSQDITFADAITKTVTIGNSAEGSAAMPYQITATYSTPTPWFSISATQGEVAGGSSQAITFTMADNLAAGDYSATVKVQAAGKTSQFQVTASLSEGELFVPTTPLSLQSTGKASFSLQNTGPAGSVLQFRMASRDNSRAGKAIDQWYDVQPEEGSIRGGGSTAITLTLNANSSEAGFYRSVLCVKYGKNFASESCFLVTFEKVDDSSKGDFSLAYDQNNYAIPPVPSNVRIRNIPIDIVRTEKFADAVNFSITVKPSAAITATFDPNPSTANRTAMTLLLAQDVAAGEYTITVTGKAGTLEHSVAVPLTVKSNQPANFTLSLQDTRLKLEAGNAKETRVTINKVGDFDDDVSLSSVNTPQGVTVSFDPERTKTSSTITLSTSESMAAGTYPVRIRGLSKGASGTLEHDVLLNLTVTTSDPDDARMQGIVITANDVRNFRVPLVGGGEASLASQAIQPLAAADFVPQQILVKYKDDFMALAAGERAVQLQARADSLQQDYDLQLLSPGFSHGKQVMPDVLAVPATSDVPAMVATLQQDPRVAYAEPNYYIYLQNLPTDPEYNKQWHLPYTGLPVAWQATTGSSNRVVAVVDSGIDINHSDFAGGTFLQGRDFCGSSQCQEDSNVLPEINSDNHGTHVAGIIAASANQRGVAGVLPQRARILPVKVFYQGNHTTANALAKAIRWAAGLTVAGSPQNTNRAAVINLSLGTGQDSSVLHDAIKAAAQAGSLLVAAAGNYGRSTLLYPAAYNEVMAVGSVNSSFRRSCFSHTGAGLDIVAPGGDYDISKIVQGVTCPSSTKPEAILSTIPANNYGLLFGTSQATPIVSGIAALVWQHNPSFSASQVRNRLKQRAYKASYMTSSAYGAGIVRADAALGLPSIGATVSISAGGQRTGDSAVDTVRLTPRGISETFSLDSLLADRYLLEASTSQNGNSLSASRSIELRTSQKLANLELVLSAE